ncbi:MAG: hypothetical protein JWP18_922, partial [Solirubrobacterales bacterium]|nr:hypothetical protein [Solirubrobacterales bacterium]
TPAGAVVTGRRRRARKLLRALRRPVTLGTLAAADVELSSVELLSLLMAAIDPQATAGEHFTVAFAHTAGPVHAHVVVADAQPIDVRPGAPAQAAATVRTGPGTLAAFLAGVAAARVSGEVDVVGRLLAWADAAQGLDA